MYNFGIWVVHIIFICYKNVTTIQNIANWEVITMEYMALLAAIFAVFFKILELVALICIIICCAIYIKTHRNK